MRAVNLGDLKNNLSRYLSAVRRGEELVVRDRNKPIARIILSPKASLTSRNWRNLYSWDSPGHHGQRTAS